MTTRMRRARQLCQMLFALWLVGAGACTQLAEPPQAATQLSLDRPAPESAASATPFQPLPSTPTPDVLRVWISPAVPDELRRPIENQAAVSSSILQIVEAELSADLVVEANARHNLAQWLYALVAPFPTVEDSKDRDEVQRIWRGEALPTVPVYMSPSTHAAMETLMGEPATAHVIQLDPAALLEATWAARPAYAILPFEQLEPRWKVLEIDGVSPIRKQFSAEGYALRVPFGVSGDPADVERFRELVAWPDSNRDPQKMTILVVTGVTALTRATAARMDQKGVDYPAQKIGSWLREADLTHISHEVSFSETCPEPDPSQANLWFCSSPRHLALFETIGVDVIELTGNHVLDWGVKAFRYTLDLYHDRNWLTFGGGFDVQDALRPALLEHNGNRFAFLGCNAAGPPRAWATETAPGAAPCATDLLFAEVERLREQGYLVVFTYQWFEGATLLPAQREAFQAAVEAGAVIVSGSQAHQPMGFEFHQGGFIHHGLGNLFFDQMQSLDLRREFIDRHVFYDGRHISTELLTAVLEDYAQPRPMSAEERAVFLQVIFAKSGW